jgi:ABC-2 type transport system ATP-binding protein
VSSTGTPPALLLRGLTKRFGQVTAVNGVSVRIEPGEVVAVLGPNGAGKSTTIDMVLGLARPDAGEVRVFGHPPSYAVARGEVAAVMQSGGLLKDFTVAETVRYISSVYPRSRPVAEVLARAGLTELADRRVGKCSGGEQQRLRFALSLVPQPRLLILDEPTAGMDVDGRREFWAAIRRDADQGRTVLFATHYLDEADAYADRIILIHHGCVVADGPTATIRSLASGRLVRAHWPDADRAALLALPGVESVEVRGDAVLVRSVDSDEVARYLLTRTDARDLEVTAANLEAAFIALTSSAADPPPAAAAPRLDRSGLTPPAVTSPQIRPESRR